MERETGFEPATSSLGSWHSTRDSPKSFILLDLSSGRILRGRGTDLFENVRRDNRDEEYRGASQLRVSPATRTKDVRSVYRSAAGNHIEHRSREGPGAGWRLVADGRGVHSPWRNGDDRFGLPASATPQSD